MAQINLGKVKGNPGITPHIGVNGNWWIGETDTGVNAQGREFTAEENAAIQSRMTVELTDKLTALPTNDGLNEALGNIESKLDYPEQPYCSGSDKLLFYSANANGTRKIPIPSFITGLFSSMDSYGRNAFGSAMSDACPSRDSIPDMGFIVGNGSQMRLDEYGSMLVGSKIKNTFPMWGGHDSSMYNNGVVMGSGWGSIYYKDANSFGKYFVERCASGMTGWYSDSSNSGSGIVTYHSNYGIQNTSKTGFWATGHGIPSNNSIGSFGNNLQLVMMTGSGGSVNGMSLPSFWNGGHGIQYDSSIGSYSGNLHVVMMTGSGGSVRSISISQFKSLLSGI